jgi:dipeptidyl-peptidase-3
VPADKFEAIVKASENAQAIQLWDKCKVKMYSLESNERELGLPPSGVSSYYSENITKADIELVQEVLNEKKIEAYNTRIFKTADGTLEVRLASAESGPVATYEHKGVKVSIVRGDFKEEMAQVVHYLQKAKEYAANEHQANMIDSYVKHFQTGEISAYPDFTSLQLSSFLVS